MKLLITHVYSDKNKGDAALLSTLISEVRHTCDEVDMTVLTYDTVEPGDTFDEVPLAHSFMHYAMVGSVNRVRKLFCSLWIIGLTVLHASVYRLFRVWMPLPTHLGHIAQQYREASLVVPVGGGYVRGRKGIAGFVELLLQLHPFVYARILGVPTVLFSQSIGPFTNRLEECITAWVLRGVTCVVVREDISFALVQRLSSKIRVMRAVDSGFLFEGRGDFNLKHHLHIPDGTPLVGITVRSWLPEAGQKRYEHAVEQLVRHIVTVRGMAVVFIPQVTATQYGDDDRAVAARIVEKCSDLPQCVALDKCYDHHTIKRAYESVDYLVGTRFHSVIFALTGYVPAIAIAYEHKTDGIMQDLSLGEWVLSIEHVTGPVLIERFDTLCTHREEYRTHLQEVLPEYITKAHHATEVVCETLHATTHASCTEST